MFWKFNLISASHIETLLNKENVSLKELMDEEDILQECKAQTKNLIDFLTRPDIMDEMVTLITQEPDDEDVDEKYRYKYANIACELLTSDDEKINDALASDEVLLNKLYAFLDTEKPLNPLLASFYSKTMGILILRKTELIFEFLKSKDDFVSLGLSHIETSAIMDLLLRLLTHVENNELRYAVATWMNDQKIVEKLVALIDPEYNEDCNGNAAQTLCDIVKVSREHMSLLQEKAKPDPLLQSLESTELVNELLNHMFKDEKKEDVIVSGIAVLLSLLEFKKQGPAGQQQISQFQTHQSNHQIENAPHSYASVFCRNENGEQMTSLDADRLAKGVNSVVAAVTPLLDKFHQLLIDPPPKTPVVTTVDVLDPPLGSTRLEVAQLLASLLSTNTHIVNLQLTNLGTIAVLIDLFFKYTWNNFFHTQVEQSLGRIFVNDPTNDEEGNKLHPLLDQLLYQYKLIERLLDIWDENEHEQSIPGKHRRGYMGHLIKIANHIAQNAESGGNSSFIKDKLKELPEEYMKKWEVFTSETLVEINKKNLVGGLIMSSNSEDEESIDFRNIPFSQDTALQQVFSDYHTQRMSNSIDDQFAFNDDDFVDPDENLTGSVNRLAHFNFEFDTDDSDRKMELFEQMCNERITALDDNGDEVWDDKGHTSFVSEDVAPQREDNSSDSDEEPELDSKKLPTINKGLKMEVEETWTANFETVPMEVAPVSVNNPWESSSNPSTTGDQSCWADFSNFSDFNAPEQSQVTSITAMETSESHLDSVQTNNANQNLPDAVQENKEFDNAPSALGFTSPDQNKEEQQSMKEDTTTDNSLNGQV